MASVYALLLATMCIYGTNAYQWDNTCQSNTFPQDISTYCAANPSAKVPVIEDCSAYFDCGVTFDAVPRYFEQHMLTCPYPELFDPVSETCQLYSNVTCCDRIKPVAPCEYRQFKCPYIHCIPCDFNRPSCAGQADGLHEVENRPNFFFQCREERTMSGAIQSCPQDMTFDSRARQCSPAILS